MFNLNRLSSRGSQDIGVFRALKHQRFAWVERYPAQQAVPDLVQISLKCRNCLPQWVGLQTIQIVPGCVHVACFVVAYNMPRRLARRNRHGKAFAGARSAALLAEFGNLRTSDVLGNHGLLELKQSRNICWRLRQSRSKFKAKLRRATGLRPGAVYRFQPDGIKSLRSTFNALANSTNSASLTHLN